MTKGKKKQGSTNGAKQQKEEEKSKEHMSKVRCFACGEMGHYASKCHKKKGSKKDVATFIDVESSP